MQSGAAQLKDWMHRRRFLQREAGEYLGFTTSFISLLVTGDRTPCLENAIHIERLTGIPVEAWLPRADDRSDDPVAVSAGKGQRDKA